MTLHPITVVSSGRSMSSISTHLLQDLVREETEHQNQRISHVEMALGQVVQQLQISCPHSCRAAPS